MKGSSDILSATTKRSGVQNSVAYSSREYTPGKVPTPLLCWSRGMQTSSETSNPATSPLPNATKKQKEKMKKETKKLKRQNRASSTILGREKTPQNCALAFEKKRTKIKDDTLI